MAACLKLVATRGYAGTSIKMICREAGLNASSLYWFFKNKEDLLGSAIRDAAEDFLAAAQLPLATPLLSPLDRQAEIGRILAQELRNNARFLRLLLIIMLEESDLPAMIRPQIIDIRARALRGWRSLLHNQFSALGETMATLLANEFAPFCRAAINGAFIAQQSGEPLDIEMTVRQLFLLLSALKDKIAREAASPPKTRRS